MNYMRYLLLALLCAAAALWGANVKLYLKDGGWHIVREYKVEGDRVRYYSVERSDWEEMPLELVDLKKTEGEITSKAESMRKEAETADAEEKAERAARREVSDVPGDLGAYYADNGQIVPLKQAETKVVTNKRRNVLKVMAPIPIISGKATLEIDGPNSAFEVKETSPEFYFRLSQAQRFSIVKMGTSKEGRVVEKITIVPVTNEMIEEPEEVEIFRREVGDLLYKIWPQKPLEPGEYAIMEYTPGKVNPLIYDFRVPGAAPAAKPAAKTDTKAAKKPKK